MINGSITGTVDVRDMETMENERFHVKSEFQGFSIVDQGRAHSALSPVPEGLGAVLRALYPIGQISAWMFADAEKPAINGFDYTGLFLFVFIFYNFYVDKKIKLHF